MCKQDAERRSMSHDVWAPMLTTNPSLCNKSLRARNKVAHVEFCEGIRGLCRDMLWLWPMRTDNAGHKNDYLSSEKKEQGSKHKNDFREVVVSNSIPHVLRDSHTSKYKRPRNKTNDGCLWKPAKRNNVRTSKQLRFVANTEILNENQALRPRDLSYQLGF